MDPFQEVLQNDILSDESGSEIYRALVMDLGVQQLLDLQTEQNERPTSTSIMLQTDDEAKIIARVCSILRRHDSDSANLKYTLLLLFQELQSHYKQQPKRLQLNDKDGKYLIKMLYMEREDRTVIANLLVFMRLYIELSNTVVSGLLERVFIDYGGETLSFENEVSVQILVQLFDEIVKVKNCFHRDPRLVTIIQRQLESEEREGRRIGYYLMKKVLQVLVEQSSNWELDTSAELHNRWTSYITIMENLEENQSHLILPSLAMLPSLDDRSRSWQIWMNILYKRLLEHSNILVNRWTQEYFLTNYTMTELGTDVLTQLLRGLNNTQLYNEEGYHVPIENIERFLECQVKFVELMVLVMWRSVPMHFWLERLRLFKQRPTNGYAAYFVIEHDVLLRLAGRIRMLPNTVIRGHAINCFNTIFSDEIAALELDEYVILVEALYNPSDRFKANAWDIFTQKLMHFAENMNENDVNGGNGDVLFTQRFYDIITDATSSDDGPSQGAYIKLLAALQILPIDTHGCLRFFVVFDTPPEVTGLSHFWCLKYNLRWSTMVDNAFSDVEKHLCEKLNVKEEENRVVTPRYYDFYSCYILKKFPSNYELLLDQGTHHTVIRLSRLLLKANDAIVVTQSLLNYFVQIIQYYTKRENVCNEVAANLLEVCFSCDSFSDEEKQAYAEQWLQVDLENVGICRAVLWSGITLSAQTYVRGLLLGEAKTGDPRVEEVYKLKKFGVTPKLLRIRSIYLESCSCEQINEILAELLAVNINLSRKKARNFENSKEHRIKMRIAYAVLYLIRTHDGCGIDHLPMMWEILLMENNQLNVSYMFECAIAVASESVRPIIDHLKQLSKYTPSQQISVISVAHTYYILYAENLGILQRTEILERLLPLTMGPNFQTRLYSQLAILSIIKHCGAIDGWDLIAKSIKAAVGGDDVISKVMQDVRLKLADYWSEDLPLHDVIMYITNAPYDEYFGGSYSMVDASKDLFNKRLSNFAKSWASPVSEVPNSPTYNVSPSAAATPVQRKMNPMNDVAWESDAMCYNMSGGNELFVVASLIDKLPNLGGIARTCEVLGIKNLVLDTKSCTEKIDFQNLSMTAEKSLNILEIKASGLSDFLMQKQAEGFKIVGAEQTASSISFVDFEFPKKTILLLGHEKEGIPANLLGFLDYAVEVPQFGIVRSLNVHVTGALFMWEYCKQHIIDNCD